MTVDGLLAILLGVAIPFLLAVAGGILAVKALPSQTKFLERSLWVGLFVGLLLIGLVLAFVQQVRITSQQSVADNQSSQRELRDQGEIRYTQGQLDSINKVLGAAISGGSSDTKTLTAALLRGALAASANANGIPPPAIQRMTAKDLRDRVLDFANAMRKEASDEINSTDRASIDNQHAIQQATDTVERSKIWAQFTQAEANQDNSFKLRIMQNYVGQAIEYRDELIRRVGPQPPNPREQGMLFWSRPGNDNVSTWSLNGTADYLERLARQLPPR